MALPDRVRAIFGRGPRRAQFAGENPVSIDTMFREMVRGTGRVSRDEALSCPAVVRGRNMLAAPISTLPLETVDEDENVVVSDLLDGNIDPNVPNVTTMAQTVEDLVFEGVAYWRKLSYDEYGFPATAQRLDPRTCSINPPSDGRWQHLLPSGVDPRGYLWVEGKPVSWLDIIRFDSPNPPLLVVGGDTVRLARAHAAAAKLYAEDPRPMDYFSAKVQGADPEQGRIRTFLGGWSRARKQGKTAYVPGDFEYNQVQQPTPADLQLLELKREDTLAVANLFGLDPEDFGVSTTSRTYANAVDRRQDRLNDTHAPFMAAITDRLSMDDVTWLGRRVRFNRNGYLRADPLTRSQVQLAYLAQGVITIDEIRRAEGMPKLTAAQRRPAPIQATVGDPVQQIEAADVAEHTFARETGLTFEGEPDATFAVDTERRTITGLAVPYGQVAKSNGRRFRFAPGSLKYASVSRVKLLRDHNNSLALGKAISLIETPAGLVAKFSVSPGRAGDEALALAADEVLDGLSVGVDFRDEHLVRDPKNPGVLLVTSAALREISLTAVPAFDDSRLTSVRASDDGRTGMDPETTTTPALVPVTLSAEQFSAMLAQFAPKPAETPAPVTEPATPPKPAVVVPPVAAGATFVNEALPYRFDRGGNFEAGGEHDFSGDLLEMARAGDGGGTITEAGKRVMGTLAATFAIASTDVNELNPEIQRPDMYVDKRDKPTPLWDSINKGAPPNGIQPFRFPKWNSESGLVGDHTEGVEPVPGSLTTTSDVVNPTPVSGKVSLPREVWDMGGNPAVSTLVYNRMRAGYRTGLETSTATFLATLSAATDIDLGDAVYDEELAAAWDSAVADLQFVEDYDFSMFGVEKNLYKAFVAAVDGNGRKLYPIINPSNANGQSSMRFRTIDLAGVIGVPAAALTSTPGSGNSSWLFDPSVVHGWATAPQRLEFPGTAAATTEDPVGSYAPVAMVDIAIWGYKAHACSDIAGVRQVIYDTTS